MKKILILSIALISLLSCSDDKNTNGLDPIIGNWYHFSENGKEVDDCSKKSTFTFTENGNFTSKIFVQNENECVEDGGVKDGKWKNKGNNTYNVNGDDGKVVFIDNNNAFSTTYKDGDKTFTTIYKRK